ncbi:SH3 domain-containing protein [Salininema proteolyticum]|uniref:SH3 domain-containing protein n=1 Tax=Salininema proteolyticum TaxID=1607685 RepID=A0ABV8TY80_9ACTN
MFKKKLLGILAAGAIAVLGVALPSAAQADPTSGDDVSAQFCDKKVISSDGVNHRADRRLDATILGWIPNGTIVSAACDTFPGDRYTACGKTSTSWEQVGWNGNYGWVADACLKYVS